MKVKRVTIKDIAKEAGVSIGTVDRVLHERGEVAEATKNKILKLAEQMHYRPNLLARALTSKRDYNVVALLPRASEVDIYWASHVAGITAGAQALESYASFLRFAGNKYKDAQTNAVNRANRLPKW